MYRGSKNVDLPDLVCSDNTNSIYLSYYCNQFFRKNGEQEVRIVDRRKKVAINFSQHCAYVDRVSSFDDLSQIA